MTEVATANPRYYFGIIDSAVDPANVSGMVFAEEQGSYLVGVAAGLKTLQIKLVLLVVLNFH